MTENNGKTGDIEVLTTDEKLDILIEAVTEMSEKLDEVIEKLVDRPIEYSAYGIENLE